MSKSITSDNLSRNIFLSIGLAVIAGLSIQWLPAAVAPLVQRYWTDGLLLVIGDLFINFLKMLIVPIIFISILNQISHFGKKSTLSKIGIKAIAFFIGLDLSAIAIGFVLSLVFKLEFLQHLFKMPHLESVTIPSVTPPSWVSFFSHLIPENIIHAMTKGQIFEIVIAAVLLGLALAKVKKASPYLMGLIEDLSRVLFRLAQLIVWVSPYGIFCLLSRTISQLGTQYIWNLLIFTCLVIVGLLIQQFGVFSLLLALLARLNPITFFKKLKPAMLFAFGTSSCLISLPVTLDVTQKRLGVSSSLASFILSLGACINLNGTVVMQVVAIYFIAGFYHVTLHLSALGTILFISLVTTGTPGAGIITLAMILTQIGLPAEGIGLIIGVDRILDMFRTVVNMTGDVVTACVIGSSENQIDRDIYNSDVSSGTGTKSFISRIFKKAFRLFSRN